MGIITMVSACTGPGAMPWTIRSTCLRSLGAILGLGLLAGCSLPGGTAVEANPGATTIDDHLGFSRPDCPYVEREGHRTYLLLGEGWVVQTDPVRIEATDGTSAEPGDRLLVSGVQDEGETLCGPGVPLFVLEVERREDPVSFVAELPDTIAGQRLSGGSIKTSCGNTGFRSI
jgi:hypothetical protein